MPGERPAGTRAIILAGGLGSRLREVCADRPKPLVTVLGRPFLDYVVEYLLREGADEIVVSAGHLGEQIDAYCAGSRPGVPVRCVREPQPMGTGGALAYVQSRIPRPGFFVASNGDSLTPLRIAALATAVERGAAAAIAGVPAEDAGRFGRLRVGSDGMLSGFAEKSLSPAPGIINAGIYLLHTSLLPSESRVRPASMERDYFPKWLAEGKRIAVVPGDGPFIDIGTPESLSRASDFIRACGLFPASD